MRLSQIKIGETYRVKLPDRLDPDHPYYLQAGDEFALTVTHVVGQDAIGLRPTSIVTVELTAEQAGALGLPSGRYSIEGMLSGAGGALVEAPLASSEEYAVPVRWIREPAS